MNMPKSDKRAWAKPYKIKMVELLRMTTREEREQAIREAGYNTFLTRSKDVYIDLLTDSGTAAMSDRQWTGLMLGDEAYAGSENFYHLEAVIKEFYGYEYMLPTHQGRGAENLMSQLLIKPGDHVPGNMYFTTTRLHQELAGGTFVDVIVDDAHDPESLFPFKGNVDIEKLHRLVQEVGANHVPYISLEGNVNMAGGQPFSMANLKELHSYCRKHGIPNMLDATRTIENAWFIRDREDGYANKSIRNILREICDLTDGCTMSAKKDALVNIGGFFASNDEELFKKHKIWLSSMRVCIPMAASRGETWRLWPRAFGRRLQKSIRRLVSARCVTWARNSTVPVSQLSSRLDRMRYLSTPNGFCHT